MQSRIENLRRLKMKIEKIFRKIPDFQKVILDTILFESKYPVLFTCKNDKDIYLFICYYVNSEKIKWIGTRTTYDNLIDLLENKITIRVCDFAIVSPISSHGSYNIIIFNNGIGSNSYYLITF